jgi:hypothetical protein
MRGAPQVGFSATMRKINSRNSLLIRFLPNVFRWREIQFQYRRNPARCQRTTVSGVTITRACSRLTTTQNRRSNRASLGFGFRLCIAKNCWRRARFSSRRSLRESKDRRNRPNKSRNMTRLYQTACWADLCKLLKSHQIKVSSSARGFHPHALTEPYVSLSAHTALTVQPSVSTPDSSDRTDYCL